MKIIKTGIALAFLASVGSHSYAGMNPCQLISASQQEELGLSGAKSSLISAKIDGKQFGLNDELTGLACEFKKDNGENIKLVSVFEVADQQARTKLIKYFESKAKVTPRNAATESSQNTIPIKDGICEGIYFFKSQLSICTGVLPNAFMIIALGEANFIGKAWPPLKAEKLFNEAVRTWAQVNE